MKGADSSSSLMLFLCRITRPNERRSTMATIRLAQRRFRLPLLRTCAAIVAHRIALVASRRGLSRLDDRLLADIGLTRNAAEAESSRPVWDPPLHWRA
jgi:uncharacterized protein YjiS (DUF1127 family)